MKVIITSDTHKEAERIKAVTEFAKSQGIDTIVDCGDLHGAVSSYEGVKLHATYWRDASGAMDEWEFNRAVAAIGGVVHPHGSTFVLEDTAIYIQHNLADYEAEIPAERLAHAKERLDALVEREGRQMEQLVLFGHTHNFHFHTEDGVTALNPGSLGLGDPGGFIVLDTETREIEYRTIDDTILTIGPGQEFTQIREVHAIEGAPLMHIARLPSGREIVVTDGERSAEYEHIFLMTRAYHCENPDQSTEVLKIGRDGRQAWTTLDLKETRAFQAVEYPPKLAEGVPYFVATDDDETQILARGWADGHEELARYKEIDKHSLKLAGGTFAVIATDEDGKQLVNTGGLESRRYDRVRSLMLEDGKPVFIACEGDEEFVVIGEQEMQRYRKPEKYRSAIANVRMIMGKPVYSVLQDGKQTVHHGDQVVAGPFPAADRWSAPVKSVAEADGLVACLVEKDGKNTVVVDGQEMQIQGTFADFIRDYRQGQSIAREEPRQDQSPIFVYVTSLDRADCRAIKQSLNALFDPEIVVVGDDLKAALGSRQYSLVIDTSTLGREGARSGVVAHDMKYIRIDQPPKVVCVTDTCRVLADIAKAMLDHYTGGSAVPARD
ncbi:metallophosphoesterase family protein [Candidatus Woesearchaeota archaeon]|nr:metallophosphoesterase family protein [Candidatus Woesearchaeota archaeon]